MIGRVNYSTLPGKTKVIVREIGLLTFADVTLHEPRKLPERGARRRVRHMTSLLSRHGVGRLIVGKDFPYPDYLNGWDRVNVIPFYRGISDLLVLEQARCKGVSINRLIVAASAPRLCPELCGAVERLCPRVKGIVIDVPEEGERYAARLHRQFGLPVRGREEADVTLAFGPTSRKSGDVISLCEECLSLNGLRVSAPELDLPEGSDDGLLAALWERGSLDRKSLRIDLDKSQ